MPQIPEDVRTGYTTSAIDVGLIRYAAPETLEGGYNVLASDVYSFACLVLHVLTGKEPFYWIRVPPALLLAKVKGDGIDRGRYTDLAPEDAIWALLDSCWQREPGKRPTMPVVIEQVSLSQIARSSLRLRLPR